MKTIECTIEDLELVVKVKLRPEVLPQVMAENEASLVDWCHTENEKSWVFAKPVPGFRFDGFWCLRQVTDELFLELALIPEYSSDFVPIGLENLDVRLAVQRAILKRVQPDMILRG